MTKSLEDLPVEIHLSIAQYLRTLERAKIAHVSTRLQQIYGPINWKTCIITEAKKHNGISRNISKLFFTNFSQGYGCAKGCMVDLVL